MLSTLLAGIVMAGTPVSASGVPASVLTAPTQALPAVVQQQGRRGTVVVHPWAFNQDTRQGTKTARAEVVETVQELAEKAGFAVVSEETARQTWEKLRIRNPRIGQPPSAAELRRFARAVGATHVMHGSVQWRTRSVWVGLGPKTISTAIARVYVFNVATGSTSHYRRESGRSDEREDAVKVAAAVLVNPLIPAVSGGPATPREVRAAQIALARAYSPWVQRQR